MGERKSNQIGQEARFEDATVTRHLTPAAVAHWPIVATQLRDAGVLGAVDAYSLACYCEAFARWCAAGEQVAKMLIEFGVRSGRRSHEGTRASQDHAQVPATETTAPKRRAPNAIVRLIEVRGETGLSRSTIYNRMKAGTFPAPVRLGARSVGWRVADVEAFLEAPADYKRP